MSQPKVSHRTSNQFYNREKLLSMSSSPVTLFSAVRLGKNQSMPSMNERQWKESRKTGRRWEILSESHENENLESCELVISHKVNIREKIRKATSQSLDCDNSTSVKCRVLLCLVCSAFCFGPFSHQAETISSNIDSTQPASNNPAFFSLFSFCCCTRLSLSIETFIKCFASSLSDEIKKERTETVTLELKKPKIYDDNSIALFPFFRGNIRMSFFLSTCDELSMRKLI